MNALTEWDRAAFLALNHGLKCGPLDWLMPRITDIGLGYVQAPIVMALALWLGVRAGEIRKESLFADSWSALIRRRAWVAPLLLCFAISGLASTALKTIDRQRPWWFYENEHRAGRHLKVQVWTVEGVYPLKVRGFPSGHTATTVAMATVVTLLFGRRRRGVFVVWATAALVGFSRMYLASHWPLDVLGGAALGVAAGFASVWICGKRVRR